MPEQTDSQSSVIDQLKSRVVELEDEVRDLRAQLWQARDATIGATATSGSFRARNAELEVQIAVLRSELTTWHAKAHAPSPAASARLSRALRDPRVVLRKVRRALSS